MMPETGIVISGVVTKVIDGDTLEVEVTRRVRVRVKDCWSPEKRKTDHPSEKELGQMATHQMMSLAGGTKVRVAAVTDGDQDLGDGLSFGRVVADVFRERDGKSLAELMIEGGFAFATKAELETHLEQRDAQL